MKNMYFIFLLAFTVACDNINSETLSFLGKKENTEVQGISENKTGIVLIADGTYSGTQYYVVPPLTTGFVLKLIDSLRVNNGGTIWVTYIDSNAQDNESLSFDVPATVPVPNDPPTVSKTGYINLENAKNEWQQNYDRMINDSVNEALAFEKARAEFIVSLDNLLTSKIYVKNSRNKWSDVNGTVSSAQTILKQSLKSGHIKKGYIIGFSDFEDDVQKSVYIPDEALQIFNLISQPGKSKNSISNSIELVSENDILKTLKF